MAAAYKLNREEISLVKKNLEANAKHLFLLRTGGDENKFEKALSVWSVTFKGYKAKSDTGDEKLNDSKTINEISSLLNDLIKRRATEQYKKIISELTNTIAKLNSERAAHVLQIIELEKKLSMATVKPVKTIDDNTDRFAHIEVD